jgi:glyoxylase I family protein
VAELPSRLRSSGVQHLGLSVSDLDRSVAFYCDVLGAVLVRPPYPGERSSFDGHMALVMVGSTALDLYEHTRNEREQFQPSRTGLDHLALTVRSDEELDAWAAWLDACGLPRSEIRPAGDVGRMFDFVDPDGIQLELIFIDHARLAHSATSAALRDAAETD